MRTVMVKAFQSVSAILVAFLIGAAFSLFLPAASGYPVIDPNDSAVHDSAGYPSWGADAAITVTSTSTTVGSAALSSGFYIIVCTTTTHVDQGATGVTALTTERTIPALSPYPLRVTGVSDTYVAWIRDAADGTCILSRDDF